MASGPERKRLFFALWPDEALRCTLYKETRHAVRTSGGKPVPPENFHITLAFLGQLDAAGETQARAAAAISAAGFHLVLDHLGFWSDARVLWLGPSAVPAAGGQFVKTLRAELRLRAIQVDIRPFQPHLTLARKVPKPGALATLPPIVWPASEFLLVHSVTTRHASEYHPLASWPLRAVAAEL